MLKHLTILCILAALLFASASKAEHYPLSDRWKSSLSGAIVKRSSNFKWKKGVLETIGRRVTSRTLYRHVKYAFHFKLQTKPADVVYIVSGLGGDSHSNITAYLSEKIFNQGYHVVALPSAFSTNFALSSSETGLVGYLPRDAEVSSQRLKEVEQKIFQSHPQLKTGRNLVGYSYGALQAAFMAQDLDQSLISTPVFAGKKSHPNFFERVLLINPPVDIYNSMARLDQVYKLGVRRLEKSQRNTIINQVRYSTLRPIFFQRMGSHYFKNAVSVLNATDVSTQGYAWFVSNSFQKILKRVLKVASVESSSVADLLKSEDFSYTKYAHFLYDQLSLTDWMKNCSFTCFKENASLKNPELSKYLTENKNIYLVHNHDDFLLAAEDFQHLTKIFRGRSQVFLTGGHVGNIWWDQALKHYYRVLDN